MTPSAFVTDDAWKEVVPMMIDGIRAQVCRAAKKHGIDDATADKLMVLLSFDGFKSHIKNLEELVIFAANLIRILCEDRDSSHINQAYDKYVVSVSTFFLFGCLTVSPFACLRQGLTR